jgi:preprotein translocase subunit SecF/SecD/SecF fusion protein
MLLKYWPAKTKVNFMRIRLICAVMSVILIGLAAFVLSTRGLNLGVDFAGGGVIEFEQTEATDVETVREAMPLSADVNTARGTGADAKTVVVIKYGFIDPEDIGEAAMSLPEDKRLDFAQSYTTDLVRNTLNEKFGLTKEDLLRTDSVGPKVSGELFRAGITALAVALALMLLYIAFRFEWRFSVGAVAALVHDVFITMGMFSLLQMEFNLTTIAALLTIIGYSMNDTVVVFDRVREEKRKYKKMPDRDVINLALNGTLSRTLLTSGTTLLALLAIFFLGGPVLRGMSFALIWGVIIGTYSSIFIASSIVLLLGLDLDRKPVEGVPGFGQAEG